MTVPHSLLAELPGGREDCGGAAGTLFAAHQAADDFVALGAMRVPWNCWAAQPGTK